MADSQQRSSNYVVLDSQSDAHCLVCTRPFALDAEVTDSFEALAICRECKMTVLNDNQRNVTTTRTYGRRRQIRSRSRIARPGSAEGTFSKQFSQLINIARQGHEAAISSPTIVRQQASYDSTPNQSQRWDASDDESDSLSYADSVFGEIESNISFGDYGGDSDASLDIDPMNAGIGQWDSDDQYDTQLDESDFDEAVDTNHVMQRLQQSRHIGPIGLIDRESEDGVLTRRRSVNQRANVANLMANTEGPEIRTPFVGNSDDYVDARQFEMLLEQFAGDNNFIRGAPPAATSFIANLPTVVISTNHQTSGGVICPVCKDSIPMRARAKQLPCMHLYHSSCILPWLISRNTCPVCRYELPTDDLAYESSRRASNERDDHGLEDARLLEIVEEISNESEVEETYYTSSAAVEETNASEHVHGAERPSRRRGWFFIAAAPVVSLVGLALVLCFTSPGSNCRKQLYRRSQSATAANVDTKRSWWSLF